MNGPGGRDATAVRTWVSHFWGVGCSRGAIHTSRVHPPTLPCDHRWWLSLHPPTLCYHAFTPGPSHHTWVPPSLSRRARARACACTAHAKQANDIPTAQEVQCLSQLPHDPHAQGGESPAIDSHPNTLKMHECLHPNDRLQHTCTRNQACVLRRVCHHLVL